MLKRGVLSLTTKFTQSFQPIITVRPFCNQGIIPLRSKKPKSIISAVQYYVDKIYVRTAAGNGGNGCIGFLSAWVVENAGPDGGDGGNGAHVIFFSTGDCSNLNHCKKVLEAPHGEKGASRDCNGKNAQHLIIKVPLGTIIKDDNSKVIADLSLEGMMFVAARGGAGGKGNRYFANDVQQAPNFAEYGGEGEKINYTLEVKSMAHIGLLGFPNAGKSTLLRAISRARPRVAPYPFTTLHPHIGMVQYSDYIQIAVADLPGLIAGSHMNRGLGIQFLQHTERCCCLIYVIDTSIPKPWEQLETLKHELTQFNEQLAERPQIIVANKMDLSTAQENLPLLEKYYPNFEIIPISGKMGMNLTKFLVTLRKIYDDNINVKME